MALLYIPLNFKSLSNFNFLLKNHRKDDLMCYLVTPPNFMQTDIFIIFSIRSYLMFNKTSYRSRFKPFFISVDIILGITNYVIVYMY